MVLMQDQAAAENTHLAATAARAKASPRAKSAYQVAPILTCRLPCCAYLWVRRY